MTSISCKSSRRHFMNIRKTSPHVVTCHFNAFKTGWWGGGEILKKRNSLNRRQFQELLIDISADFENLIYHSGTKANSFHIFDSEEIKSASMKLCFLKLYSLISPLKQFPSTQTHHCKFSRHCLAVSAVVIFYLNKQSNTNKDYEADFLTIICIVK